MQWRPRTLALARVAVAVALLSPSTAQPDWVLWPSPFEGSEAIDQQQTRQGGHFPVPRRGSGSVGQTFVPQAPLLRRIDVQVMNRYDVRPGLFRIWRWRGSLAQTTRRPPLFEDTLVLAGRNTWQTRSFFPELEVVPGKPYYFELSAPDREAFFVRRDPQDAYAAGKALAVKGAETGWLHGDLWFRTWAPNATSPTAAAEVEWSEAGPWHAPRAPRPVSRDDYRTRVAETADHLRPRLDGRCGRKPALAIYDAFLYQVSCTEKGCDDRYAKTVRDLLLQAHARRFCVPGLPAACDAKQGCEREPRITFSWLERPALAYAWTRGSQVYSAADHAAIRALFVDSAGRFWPERELGSFNRSLRAAVGYQLLSNLYPEQDEAAGWRAYADAVWASFLESTDTEEDSSSYTAGVFIPGVLLLAKLSNRDAELWQAPGFRSLVARLADQVLPPGVLPPYGDGSGWAMGQAGLSWLLESAAVQLDEPRYRWLARQGFEFVRSRARDRPPAADVFANTLPYLALAYLDARDDPAGEAPAASEAGSVVTERREAVPRTLARRGRPAKNADFTSRLVPNKLVLKSGAHRDDLGVLVSFLSGYRHGRLSSGAVEALLDGGSILLSQTAFPYGEHALRPEDESTALVRRYAGGRYQQPGGSAELSRFVERDHVTLAQLDWLDAEGWGVEQSRRFLFVKNRLLWVRDGFRFPAGMTAAVGPVWHAGDVSGQRGPHWFDVSYREPMGSAFKFRNPERYATLFFVPRADATVEALRESSYDPPESCDDAADANQVSAGCAFSPPFVLSQRWSGEAQPGESRWLDSVIVPHGPALGPGEAAKRIRVLEVRDDAVALEIQLGEERWILIDNPSRQLVEVPGVTTDASFAALRLEPPEHRYELALDATILRSAAGERSWDEPTTMEEGDTRPLRLPR